MPSIAPLSKSQQLRRRYGIPDLKTAAPASPAAASCGSCSSCSPTCSPRPPLSRRSSSPLIYWLRTHPLSKKSAHTPHTPHTQPLQLPALTAQLTALDAELASISWEVLSHRTQLRASASLAEVVHALRTRHVGLRARVRAARDVYAHVEGALYLLGKTGVGKLNVGVGGPGGEERLVGLVGFLGGELEGVEAQLEQAEEECARRVLRPVGLEVSLVLD
ncbi:hypothetical protein BZA05DRAFT_467772 [Tricharina praecox]|uniref:uncharacterized protein n=1 Tax=Tricharina praecox TaxID=43433 RepID=UPI0022204077|nr:uncharacterized protein BZA05DRAFT_467772 [Tricharina praecox]KAI5854246.1 hypothetical protein BZA05DRAFT_467772 [Tricharina praecox]